jgi:hypothetical protein
LNCTIGNLEARPMSIASILAFVIAGAAAFKGPRDKADESPKRSAYKALKAELSDVKGERDRQYEENVTLHMRIAELEGDVARANVQYRRDQELIDIWRERALGPPAGFGRLQPAGPDFRPPQIALQQAAAQMQSQQAMLAQYNNQQALNAQNYQSAAQGLGQAMGQLGAQSLINAELWCNCVPARHDMFLPRGG